MTSRFIVDFNELIEPELIMLSQTDLKKDIDGAAVMLFECLEVEVQEENLYDDGTHEILFGRGVWRPTPPDILSTLSGAADLIRTASRISLASDVCFGTGAA